LQKLLGLKLADFKVKLLARWCTGTVEILAEAGSDQAGEQADEDAVVGAMDDDAEDGD
jgi:hypothetical protein